MTSLVAGSPCAGCGEPWLYSELPARLSRRTDYSAGKLALSVIIPSAAGPERGTRVLSLYTGADGAAGTGNAEGFLW